MAGLTTQEAAAVTGRNRSTIWRAIKTGKVSATKSETGDYLVEPVELARAFGPLTRQEDACDDAEQPPATARDAPSMQVELALLRARAAALEADKEDLRRERDRLLGVIEQQTEQVKLLSDRSGRARRGGFWRGLLGRAARP